MTCFFNLSHLSHFCWLQAVVLRVKSDPVFCEVEISPGTSSFRFWPIYISGLQFDLVITSWKETKNFILWAELDNRVQGNKRKWEFRAVTFFLTEYGVVSEILSIWQGPFSKQSEKSSIFLQGNQRGREMHPQSRTKAIVIVSLRHAWDFLSHFSTLSFS